MEISTASASTAPPSIVPASDSDTALDASLIIPIQNSQLFVEIFAEEIAETPVTTILQVLQDENSTVDTFADASLLYMQTKHARESLTLLEEACAKLTLPECDTLPSATRARILSAAGIAQLATAPGHRQTLDDVRQQADQKFTQAGKVDTFFPMTWLGQGMLHLMVGRFDQAKFFFQTTLKQCHNSLPALLGMAAVLYGQKQYQAALEMYAQAIQKYPHSQSGASIRVGFALCCYQLGQVDRAKAAFARALNMDPECVPAMVGTAILDMAGIDSELNSDFGKTEKAIKLMSMANLLDQGNAMVQNHLANHYFWKWSPLPGTVRVKRGSNIVHASQAIPGLEHGERIRIGTNFETTIAEDANLIDTTEAGGTVFRMQDVWKQESSDDMNIAKKDYDRVIALAKGAYGSTSVPEIQAESLFFLARVYHVREENDTALKFYEKACKLNPDLAPARFGLAQTLVVKGELTQAKNHLHKLLATSGNATDSLALLGLLEVKGGGQGVENGLANLSKAVELDPFNPDFLVLEALALSQHRSTYAKAADKLEKAIDIIKRKGESVHYEVYANRGVLCEGTNRHDEALKMYTAALDSLDPSKALSEFSLDSDSNNAAIRQDDNFMFCGYVDSKIKVQPVADAHTESQESNEEAPHVTTFSIVAPSDMNLSTLPVNEGDPVRIGTDFVSRVSKIDDHSGDISIVLEDEFPLREGQFELYVKRENQILSVPEATTVAFNIARLHEVKGRTMAAIEIHKAILKRNPAYFPSALRLACISVDCGSLTEGAEWLKIAAAIEKSPEVLTLIGNLHLSLCDWAAAQPIFDDLLAKKVPNVESYAMLSLGTIYFSTLHVNPGRYAKHLMYASDYYKAVLGKDSANAYAANGIGAVLAEKGEIIKAKEIFNRVREVSGDTIADALLNLGHILLATKKHPEALQMYQSYMKRAEDIGTPVTSKSRKDDVVDVLLYIAFAYFDWARHTELSNDQNAAPADERYKKAMEHLELAMSKHTKREIILKYDLAMTKLQAANCVLQKSFRNIPRTVEEVEEALAGLHDSLKVVTQILDEKAEKKTPISSSTLESFITHCQANIQSAESHLEDERHKAAEAERERNLRRAVAEAELKEEQYKAALDRERKLKEQEDRDKKAEAAMAKVDTLRENWQQEQTRAEEAKEKKSKKKNGENPDAEALGLEVDEGQTGKGLFDDSSDEESVDEPEPGADASKSKPSDLFGDSSDDEDNVAEPSKPAAKDLFGDSSDDEEEADLQIESHSGTTDQRSAPESSTKPSANDLFGDSDDESDEELIQEGDDGKRKNEDADAEEQPHKKQRILADSDEED